MLKEIFTISLLLLTTASIADTTNSCDNFAGSWHGQVSVYNNAGETKYDVTALAKGINNIAIQIQHPNAPLKSLTGTCKGGVLTLYGIRGYWLEGLLIDNEITLHGTSTEYNTSTSYSLTKDA